MLNPRVPSGEESVSMLNLRAPSEGRSFSVLNQQAPSGEGSFSMLNLRAPSGEGSYSMLNLRGPSGEGSFSTLNLRAPSGEGSVRMLNLRAPSGEGSFSMLNSWRNDCARQFGSPTGLWTAETRVGDFGPGVFAIAFHFSALRPSRRRNKPDSWAILLLAGAAAPRRESGRPAGSAGRDRAGETDRWGARGQRGGEHAARRWSRGRGGGGVSRGGKSGIQCRDLITDDVFVARKADLDTRMRDFEARLSASPKSPDEVVRLTADVFRFASRAAQVFQAGSVEALVRPFCLIMNHDFADGAIQRIAAHEDHPVEILGL